MTAPQGTRRPTTPIWGLVLTLALMVVAAVLLAFAHWTTPEIIGLLTAVGAAAGSAQLALSQVAKLDQRTQRVEQHAESIDNAVTERLGPAPAVAAATVVPAKKK